MGEEKQTAIKLLRKHINLEVNGDPLQIKSVVVPVGVRGCIYIEAFKQSHVKAALTGVNALGMGKWQQPMVPINEMADVLKVRILNLFCLFLISHVDFNLIYSYFAGLALTYYKQ